MQTLASEAAVALERLRAGVALEEALTRERLLASIARRLRSELDLAAALAGGGRGDGTRARRLALLRPHRRAPARACASAPSGTSRRSGLSGERDARARSCCERAADEHASSPVGTVGRAARRAAACAVRRLVRARRPAFVSPARAPRAARAWSKGDLALLEAVAAEIGLALRLARLLEENASGSAQQSALLRAAQVLSGELELPVVLQRLADQLARAARGRRRGLLPPRPRARRPPLRRRARLRPVAARLRVPGRARSRRRRRSARAGRSSTARTARSPAPVPHPAYEGFTDVIVAPMRWSDEVQRRARRRPARAAAGSSERDADVLEAFAGPRLARAAQRRDVHPERAAGAHPARLLPHRLGARAVALARGDARGGRAGGGRGARRRFGRRARCRTAAGSRSRARTSCRRDSPRMLGERDRQSGRAARPRRAAGRVIAAPALRTTSACRRTCASAAAARGYRSLLSVPVEAPRHDGRRARRRLLRRGARRSATTTSSSRATSPTRRAARSSGASCSRPSAAPARWRSS